MDSQRAVWPELPETPWTGATPLQHWTENKVIACLLNDLQRLTWTRVGPLKEAKEGLRRGDKVKGSIKERIQRTLGSGEDASSANF